MTLAEFNKLKAQVDRLASEAAQAEGACKQLMRDLEREFGVKDLKAAEKLLAQLEKEAEAAEAKHCKALAAFTEKWEGKLQ